SALRPLYLQEHGPHSAGSRSIPATARSGGPSFPGSALPDRLGFPSFKRAVAQVADRSQAVAPGDLRKLCYQAAGQGRSGIDHAGVKLDEIGAGPDLFSCGLGAVYTADADDRRLG